MRKIVAFLAVVAVTACDSRVGSSFVAPLPTIAGTYRLRTYNGVTPPAVVDQTVTSTTTVVGDTLTFANDGTMRRAYALVITAPPAAPTPRLSVTTGTYSASGGNVTVTLPNGAGGFLVFTGTYAGGSSVTLTNAGAVSVYQK
jgi:hypothetical protein